MLSSYDNIEIIKTYTNPLVAVKEIGNTNPDVVFLDIEMGGINGLEIAELFIEQHSTVEIVFTTAHSQYAVDAFEVNAMDYLGKSLTWRTKKMKELFAYLWIKSERPVSKTLIMETIFPDKEIEKGASLLHTTVYPLRKSLEKIGHPNAINYFNDSYQLNIPISSDLEELNNLLKSKKCSEEKGIREILRIYKGDFLQDESYPWSIEVQQRYKEVILNILGKYVKLFVRKRTINLNCKNLSG